MSEPIPCSGDSKVDRSSLARDAIAAVLAEPEKFVRILSSSENMEAAIAKISEGFDIDSWQAETVTLQQFRLLIQDEQIGLLRNE